MNVKQRLIASTALACLLAGCAAPMTRKRGRSQARSRWRDQPRHWLAVRSGSGRVIMTGAGAVLGTVVGGKIAE